MPSVDTVVETSASPERVREALLDFSPQRPERWPGLTASLYEVYEVGDRHAEVKEGTAMPGGGVWARERYEWDDSDTIRWTVVESNFCAPGSYVSATLKPREGGGTRAEIHWERTPTSFAGRIATFLIVLTRGKPVADSARKGLAKLES